MSLAKTIWWWHLRWRDGWTPDSITKFGCAVNIENVENVENVASRTTHKLQKASLEDFRTTKIGNILVQMSVFDNPRREKKIQEDMFYFELRNIIYISCVVCSHRNRSDIE